jgi:molybdopterin synthase sulfur carrier subunit
VTVQVTLPLHLRTLARVNGPVALDVPEPVTQRAILDALEAAYPMLRGTIRDIRTKERRAFIRFFACGEDLSHEPSDAPVPPQVASGSEPYRIIGAMAGG